MVTTKLTDLDRSVLARLRGNQLTAAELADRLTADVDADAVSERLVRMADNDLVRPLVDDSGSDDDADHSDDSDADRGDGGDDNRGGDRYALTESGRRVLQSPNTAAADEAIDLPPSVREALADSSVGVDCAETVKHAFTFLREWKTATVPELKAGVFPETSTGYRDADEWWDNCAREVLAGLPRIEPGDETAPFWRYVGDSAADGTVDDADTDGRAVLRGRDGGPRYANLTHVLVDRGVTSEQRLAAAAAFDALRKRGEATTEELRTAASEAVPETENERPDDRWFRDELPELLAAVPLVDRLDDRWRVPSDASDAR
ncbi:hypothetical protein [Haloprofundus sp. MHR1]|uniref:hypothetical protein n=1 Tax=Haloprofundus sp. MHR1 TaxID=2572921 RepID=UPI0010BE74D0|nr:hypothetical protein [Haloprofundus sp. MHR1]QCJ47311.1 hypothetical protein FCF25_09365 [Haloprofundus sp. MHR1]